MVADICLGTVFADSAWHTIASPAAVVKYKDIAFARQSFRNHMAVMLSNDLTHNTKLFCLSKVRTNLPYNLASLLADNR